MLKRRVVVVVGLALMGAGCPPAAKPPVERGPCPEEMAYVPGGELAAYCVDRWEASVVEVRAGEEVAHPPTEPVTELEVKAVSREGVVPQGYISKVEAERACKNAGKRLCSAAEWEHACRGERGTTFPYGDHRERGRCNDVGHAPLRKLFPELGDGVYASNEAMNDPRINLAPNTVAKTGAFERCESGYGAFDMVGNLHEWVADEHGASRGMFRGGYYQDTHLNGDGCRYRTVAHGVTYHDYSIGFRCCKDARRP